MKPGESAASIAVLPRRSQTWRASAIVASDVAWPRTSSTSGMSGTGFMKCRPTTRAGRAVAAPSAVMDTDEVLEANVTCGAQMASSAAKSARFAAASSAMASTMKSAFAHLSSVSTHVMRDSVPSRFVASMVPFATNRSRLERMADLARSYAAAEASWTTTSKPACAKTCAMPAPMVPAPTTATDVGVVMSAAFVCNHQRAHGIGTKKPLEAAHEQRPRAQEFLPPRLRARRKMEHAVLPGGRGCPRERRAGGQRPGEQHLALGRGLVGERGAKRAGGSAVEPFHARIVARRCGILTGMTLVLASASPRRAELLQSAGFTFDVRSVDIDERRLAGEPAETYVQRVAWAKAEAVAALCPDDVVLAADTAVVLGDGMSGSPAVVLGKPVDAADAIRMLRTLSGRTHEVQTGVAIVAGARRVGLVESTRVWFSALSEDDLAWYVATGEPMDKAGAYAIQGGASRFIPRIDGSYSNVVGLPVAQVTEALRLFMSGR